MLKRAQTFSQKNQSGFTLTEVAIVLLLVAGVVSAIWVAADKVWANYRVYRVLQQVTSVVQNTRDYYNNRNQLAPAVNTPITTVLDGLDNGRGIFPQEMRRNPAGGAGGAIDHAINNTVGGGSFIVQVGPVQTAFRVRLLGLTSGPCTKLLMSLPLGDPQMGISRVGTANMANTAAFDYQGNTATAGVSPMTVGVATGWCNAAGSGNEVDIDFNLH